MVKALAKAIKIAAYDRDGVLLAAPTYGAGHPSKVNYQNIVQRIDPVVAQEINKNGGVVLSNQDGAARHKSLLEIRWEFEKIIEQVPGICLCLWSLPGTSGNYGDHCEGLLVRRPGYPPTNISESWRRYGNFRKPDIGMFKVAESLGFKVSEYVGDLSGLPHWADGKDSDKKAAEAAGVLYQDIEQKFPNCKTRKR